MVTVSDLESRVRAIRARVDLLQSNASGRAVLFRHDPTGLGGQISRRLLAIRVAMISGRTAVFPDESFYPYKNAFEPLSDVGIGAISTDMPMWNGDIGADRADVVAFDFWSFWQNEDAKRRIYEYTPPELVGVPDARTILDGVIFNSFTLKPDYNDMVSKAVGELSKAGPLVGVHFRRGDKYVETPYVSAERYRSAIEDVAGRSGIRSIFVSSDSPNAIRELSLDADRYETIFDADEKRYNNANHRFLMKYPSLARQETSTAIRNIYMLASCDRVVGQSNAHFATLAAGSIAARSFVVDYGRLLAPEAAPAKLLNRIVYAGYRGARLVAKKIFFMRTLRNSKHGRA